MKKTRQVVEHRIYVTLEKVVKVPDARFKSGFRKLEVVGRHVAQARPGESLSIDLSNIHVDGKRATHTYAETTLHVLHLNEHARQL